MTKSHAECVAANVRAEVARRQIRQSAIAEHLGINQQQVSRRLTGVVEFSASELQAIAELLEVPVAALYGEAVA